MSRRPGTLTMLALCLALALAPVACARPGSGQVQIGDATLDVIVALSPTAQAEGLAAVDPLAPDQGMLFEWAGSSVRTFAIKDVDYPLDVIFISGDRKVIEVLPLDPDGPTTAQSATPARWVIETRAGWAEAHGVVPGAKVVIDDE